MPGQVTVASKLPNGLILRVFDISEIMEPVMGGGTRKATKGIERPERATINGWSHPQNAAPSSQIVGGFALTHGVDKDLWDLWLKQNAKTDMVKNGLIFAHEKAASTEAEAKEKATVKSGLERLDPDNLPKGLKKVGKTEA